MVCFSSPKQLNDPLEGVPPIRNPIGSVELAFINAHAADYNFEDRLFEGSRQKFLAAGKSSRVARKLATKLLLSKPAKGLISGFPMALAAESANLTKIVLDNDLIGETTDGIGVFSMTETISSGPMWVHYGHNFEGFGLEFDLNSDFFHSSTSGTFLPKSVLYENRVIDGLGSMRDQDILMTKNVDWSYEKEWRMLRDRDTASLVTASGHCLFAINASAIRNIIVGHKVCDENIRKIKMLCRDNNWGLLRANPDRKSGKIAIRPSI